MSAYPQWQSLRETDALAGTGKGAAFRAFKAREPQLREGLDYRVLDAHADRDAIETLRHAGRIYPSSVQVLLLSPDLARQIAQDLRAQREPVR